MLVNGLFGFFFFTSLKPAEFAGEGCLADNYYGTYGNTGLFLLRPESQCLASLLATAPPGFVEEGVLIAKGDQQLMYIHKLPIQDDTDSGTQLTETLQGLDAYATNSGSDASDSQTTFGLGDQREWTLLQYLGNDAILGVPPHLIPHIDKALPRSYKAYAIPAKPLEITPVPEEAVARVKGWLDHLKFNEEIASIASDISVAQMHNDIRYLTGEDSSSPIMSRHSFSEGARIAANWLKDRIERTGAHCEFREFLVGFAPNVVWYVLHGTYVHTKTNDFCSRYKSLDPDAGTIIMSAHYDSRGSFGSTRHPGADDDGLHSNPARPC
jgi:hypothetical protein